MGIMDEKATDAVRDANRGIGRTTPFGDPVSRLRASTDGVTQDTDASGLGSTGISGEVATPVGTPIVEVPRALFDWFIEGRQDNIKLVRALRDLLIASEGLVRPSETFYGYPALERAWLVAKQRYDETEHDERLKSLQEFMCP